MLPFGIASTCSLAAPASECTCELGRYLFEPSWQEERSQVHDTFLSHDLTATYSRNEGLILYVPGHPVGRTTG